MSQNYNSLANVASQGAGKQAYRENFGMRRQTPGMAGGNIQQTQCHFPEAPPHRCYCSPAAFHSVDGSDYHRLVVAYGASRPCSR